MAKSNKKIKTGEKPTRKKNPKEGMTTEELTQKHMSDPNHNITDEEIRNVHFDDSEVQDQVDLPEGDERPHDVDKDHRFTTPWDVIKDS